MSLRVKFSCRSVIGNVRTNNEDNLFCNGIIMTVSERERPFFMNGQAGTPCIFAVCDGMGGEDCGELASLTAVETLQEHSRKILRNLAKADENITAYVVEANKKLLDIMRTQRIRMGTTLVLALVEEESFTIYNLGDSRGFRIEDGRLLRVTDDHTVAEDKMRMGLITPAQAEKSSERHILTRCLGVYEDEFTLAPDSSRKFDTDTNTGGLLCSDGLTDMLTFPEISRIMKANPEPSEAVNNLVKAALERGGRDNITCIVFKIEKEEI